ncbi:hypothetical protein GLAREA_06446 [Glarea lozoyensis ATCC 20868]|uniref:Integral membrane protein n=1 Tax=Glarea lozoyensis (strain ATCC 20868 / MF5171) TaxID=1116229 RepID=S3E4T9_GLAL2|nr:uncharacterized protein GLAREA_06446 [Glarea lozoyensis ATCC 20868]EPE33433.1 hypothetical protein GLAREA_06446 [Glarea lozoyensis ATCC 20868]
MSTLDNNNQIGSRISLDGDENPTSPIRVDNHSTNQNLQPDILFPTQTITLHDGVLHRLRLMCTRFPIRDTSFLTGFVFTWGSAMFIINGFMLVIPTVNPKLAFPTITSHAAPATAIVGGVIFILGGWVGYLEGLNFKRDGEFVMTVGMRPDDVEAASIADSFKRENTKSDNPLRSMTLQQLSQSSSPPLTPDLPKAATQAPPSRLALIGSPLFIWYPSLREFTSFYWSDLCFMSPTVTFIGTFIFMLAIITAVPGVLDLTDRPTFFLGNLFPGTLGGVLFTTASVMQAIDAQEKWYLPKHKSLDWHVGLWNTIGSIGFTLASALYFLETADGALQAGLASLWGSWAFLVASLLQWYGAMAKYT